MLRALYIATFVILGVSCSHTDIEVYQGVKPEFNIREFFSGELQAHGIVKNRSGKVIRTFIADIDASWDGDTGTLDETFMFNDGEKQRRIWTLKEEKNEAEGLDETFIGTAEDVIGSAKISRAGNALFLKYVLRIPYEGKTIDITIDDRMYLIDENHLINESKMIKFGWRVGNIVLSIKKIAT